MDTRRKLLALHVRDSISSQHTMAGRIDAPLLHASPSYHFPGVGTTSTYIYVHIHLEILTCAQLLARNLQA
jgi:hypothetical protein